MEPGLTGQRTMDSHCHLTHARFSDDLPAVLERMRQGGIDGCMTIGTGTADAIAARSIARGHPGVLASAGLDPFSAHQAGDRFDSEFDHLRRLLVEGGFAAIGECGIEHHHPLAPAAAQHRHFAMQAALAVELDLPIVVHARSGARGGDAHGPAIAVLRAHPGVRGIIHSFDGTPEQARAWLDLGFHIAVNGMVTYKGNDALRSAVASIPADRLLLETDAPYLTPVPQRGQRCEPAHVAITAAAVAELRGQRCEDVLAWAARNARQVLGGGRQGT